MSILARPLKWPPIFPLEKGLVLWLPFDDRSGARAIDRSMKGNHGTLYGPSWVARLRGAALSLDGVDDYVQIGHSPSLNITNALTIEALVWANAVGNGGILEKTIGGAVNKQFLMFLDDNTRYYGRIMSSGGAFTVESNEDYPLNTWMRLAFTYDGLNGALYRDGVARGSAVLAVAPIDSGVGVSLVGSLGSSIYRLNGLIAMVQVFNRALSAAEIRRHYESELALARH